MIRICYYHPRFGEEVDVETDCLIDIRNNCLHFWSGVQDYVLPIALVRTIGEVKSEDEISYTV